MDTLYDDAAADNDGDNNDDIENRAIHENSDILDNGVVFYCMPVEHIREKITDDNYDHEGCEDEYNDDNVNDIFIVLLMATMTMNTLLGVDCLRKHLERRQKGDR